MSTTGQKLSEFVKLLDDTGQNVVPTVGTLGELPAAADNNGLTYYVDSVGRFKSDGVDWNPVDRPLTLEMFDATGDNSTDNASAIAAAEASDETDIWLNDGVYYTTSSSFTKNYIGPGEIRTSGGLHIIGNDRRKLTKWREKSRAIQETTIAAASGTVDAYYTAWPFGCKFITSDGGNDYVNQVYTAGKGHTNGGGGGTFNNKIVLFRRAQIGNESDPIVYGGTTIIADKTASNLDCFTHGACQASNGDLLTIVQTVNTSGSTTATQVYRSTDNGSTWAADNAQWLKSDGVTPLGNPSEAGDMFVTSSGRILTWFRRGDNGESIVQYSDDHGATWVDNVANTIGNTGRGVGEYEALEGKFTETTDGTIVAIVRQSADSVYSAREAAMFTVSADDGETWSDLAETNLSDMTECNAAVVYHADRRIY
ncbi:sialidase family protein, partial [Zhongshania sp.]|uniref:sialidase family protein n=1 Tax=Zhongshania sp. TaxID=1971902 RepID=UPI00356A7342